MSKVLVILATLRGNNQIEIDINETFNVAWLSLRGLPKALLPISGRPALDYLYDKAKERFSSILLVTNAHNFPYYNRWAVGRGIPRHCIINVGFNECPLAALALVDRIRSSAEDLAVIRPEFLASEARTDELMDFLASTPGNVIVCNDAPESERLGYCLSQQTLSSIDQQLATLHDKRLVCQERPGCLDRAMTCHFGASLASVSFDEGHAFVNHSTTLQAYLDKWISFFDQSLLSSHTSQNHWTEPIHSKAYARVGLMGNPSDGFYGKTLSLLISNFWANVTLIPHQRGDRSFSSIHVTSLPAMNPYRFDTFASLSAVCKSEGYDHGERLLLACCHVFFQYCQKHHIAIHTEQGFQVVFETNIPRQVGLAGSSAIVTAMWKALLTFYRVTSDDIPLERQASLILSVEADELGIAAGLQDRVVQVYGGLVYMDFAKDYMQEHGHGQYESLDLQKLPPLWLAYEANPQESGKVHSTVKQRFLAGDTEVIDTMREFASLTDRARACLDVGDINSFSELMTSNFELRRRLYGDAAVGASNLKMVSIAREHGCVAKLSGSGGAVVGMWTGNDDQTREQDLDQLRKHYEKEGFVFMDITPKDLSSK